MPALGKLKNKALKIALKPMLSKNLFNTMLSRPSGILKIMNLCMKLIKTENYRSMGFCWMVIVQDEMQIWDTDELYKLEKEIEKESTLDFDLSLALGIFLSTIGPVNDFFVNSQFKETKVKPEFEFNKKVSLTSLALKASCTILY